MCFLSQWGVWSWPVQHFCLSEGHTSSFIEGHFYCWQLLSRIAYLRESISPSLLKDICVKYRELGWWALLSYFKCLTLCLVNVGRHFGSLSFTGQASAYFLGCPPTLPSLTLPSLPLALCMLSAVAFACSCVCSGGCSPRCIWHLPFLFGKLSGIFFISSTSYSSCSLFRLYGIPETLLVIVVPCWDAPVSSLSCFSS